MSAGRRDLPPRPPSLTLVRGGLIDRCAPQRLPLPAEHERGAARLALALIVLALVAGYVLVAVLAGGGA